MIAPEIVLGPPGTGKTTTLIRYVEDELAAGTKPNRIGYVSFTRRAAEEAVQRACERFGRDRGEFPYFRTLHSLCFRFLGLTSADVMEKKRLQEFADYAGVEVRGRVSDDGSLWGFGDGDRILFTDNLARLRKLSLREQYEEDDDDLQWAHVERVALAYKEFKHARSLMDYTDMLYEFVRIPERPGVEVLFVDEAQDLSRIQWDVVQELARGCRRVVVAGDDDQAIYKWAGADVPHFVSMSGKVTVLKQSYRVPRSVQAVAQRPISAIENRRDKTWEARDEEGVVAGAPDFEKVDLAGDDVLVLARNDYVLREQVEPWLRENGIVYEKHGYPSVRRAVVDAILSWERLRRGEPVSGAEARAVYGYMATGTGVRRGHKELSGVPDDGEVTMRALQRNHGLMRDDPWFTALESMNQRDRDYITAARRSGERVTSRPRVRVSTIHGSKGGQADHVILMTEMAHRTHDEMRRGGEEDEARVWYVGITRAKRKLTIVGSTTDRVPPWL